MADRSKILFETAPECLRLHGPATKLNPQEKEEKQNRITLINNKIHLSQEQILELSELVQNWLDKNIDSNSEDNSLHQLTMVVFPVDKK